MNLNDLRNIDPQRLVTLRFGKLNEDGESVEWDAEGWETMRLLVSEGDTTDDWYLTPISREGRPFSLTLRGEPWGSTGRFLCVGEQYVMEVREMRDGPILRAAFETGDVSSYLQECGIGYEELSPLAQLFYEATVRREDIPEDFLESILSKL